jgi:nucleoside-diphosphate-sugar epimerase
MLKKNKIVQKMTKKTISILGCGWLGLPLAQSFIDQGHAVKGTTTQASKLERLTVAGIETYEMVVRETTITGAISTFLANTQVLIINMPPGLRANPTANFPAKIRLLMQNVQAHKIEQVLFVSSTSVFEDAPNFPTYTEDDTPNASSTNGKQLMEAELAVRSYYHTATIIRAGGLIGGDRNPVKMLSGKTGLKNPDAPVNLVNRDYLIEIIHKIVNGELLQPLVHVVNEPQITRKEYYIKQAIDADLELPQFEENGLQIGKFVRSGFKLGL